MKVAYAAAALRDLRRIREHIGKDNPVAASRVSIQLTAACDSLEHLPERGRPGLKPGTREVTLIWPYVIVHRIKRDAVEIVRIWHGAQGR